MEYVITRRNKKLIPDASGDVFVLDIAMSQCIVIDCDFTDARADRLLDVIVQSLNGQRKFPIVRFREGVKKYAVIFDNSLQDLSGFQAFDSKVEVKTTGFITLSGVVEGKDTPYYFADGLSINDVPRNLLLPIPKRLYNRLLKHKNLITYTSNEDATTFDFSKYNPELERDWWECGAYLKKHAQDKEQAFRLWVEWSQTASTFKSVDDCERKWAYMGEDNDIKVPNRGASIDTRDILEVVGFVADPVIDVKHRFPKPELNVWENITDTGKLNGTWTSDGSRTAYNAKAWQYSGLLKRYVWIAQGGMIGDKMTGDIISWADALKASENAIIFDGDKSMKTSNFSSGKVGWERWLRDPLRSSCSDYCAFPLIWEGLHSRIKTGRFNTYNISPCEGRENYNEKMIRLFVDHIKLLTTSEIGLIWMLDWLSHVVRYPGEKLRTIPLLISPEGAGKGWLHQILIHLLGVSNVSTMSNVRSLANPAAKNGFIRGVVLSVCPEFDVPAAEFPLVMAKLRTIVGDTYQDVDGKYAKQDSNEATYAKILLCANRKDCLSLMPTDTRIQPWFSSRVLPPPEYYKKIFTYAQPPLPGQDFGSDECEDFLVSVYNFLKYRTTTHDLRSSIDTPERQAMIRSSLDQIVLKGIQAINIMVGEGVTETGIEDINKKMLVLGLISKKFTPLEMRKIIHYLRGVYETSENGLYKLV